MILVTGATGNVGGSVLRQLRDAGERVRVLSRNRTSLSLHPDAEVVTGDLSDLSTLSHAFDGVERMFLFPAPSIAADLGQLARDRGVCRAVVLSSAANQRPGARNSPIAAKHDAVESTVRSAGLAWTILRPDTFAANALAWAPSIRTESVVRAPCAQSQRNPIHEADIAAVAVAALLEDGHEGEIYLLTGQESLTQAEQVRAIGVAIGRTVRFEEQTREQARMDMIKRMPEKAADQLLDYLARCVGVPAHVSDTVERITGRGARTFAQWAHDHADEFR
jgi:uncharacterized protein YbjT (DUF2867 family)